jgi:hypothetical protein
MNQTWEHSLATRVRKHEQGILASETIDGWFDYSIEGLAT